MRQLDLQGLMMGAFARSAEMPYAELEGATTWDEKPVNRHHVHPRKQPC